MKIYDIYYKDHWLGLYASMGDIDKAKKELLDSGEYSAEIVLTEAVD